MYKSGDIVRLMPDRGVEFVGRRDLQVKLNGQRIELDEITGQIIQSGQVGEAAVIAVRKPDFPWSFGPLSPRDQRKARSIWRR